jgi:proline dehydrogenase
VRVVDRLLIGALSLVPKWLVWPFAKPYVAGPALDDALDAVRRLNAEGCVTTVDVLGEFITTTEEAVVNADRYAEVFHTLERTGLEPNVSVKPTSLGLKIDVELAYENADRICRLASERGGFVRLDMEDSTCTEDTVNLYFRLHERHPCVGVALQAYLHRTVDDAKRLGAVKANVRLCKGIYVEPPEVAIQSYQGTRDSFMEALGILFDAGSFVGIATHDDWLVEQAQEQIAARGLDRDRCEFQMLLGVRPELRRRLVAAGNRLRVYVPFGEDWYAYSMRRLRENPRMVRHIIKALFRRG